jgi:hypothetical protein
VAEAKKRENKERQRQKIKEQNKRTILTIRNKKE